MRLDFSKVSGSIDDVETKFDEYCCAVLDAFAQKYAEFYDDNFVEKTAQCKSATHKLIYIIGQAQLKKIPMYLIVDEYDNFTNTILSLHGEKVYKAITHGEGFYRDLFKIFKGSFERIFLTGVSPVTLDDLTSGFNIVFPYLASYLCPKKTIIIMKNTANEMRIVHRGVALLHNGESAQPGLAAVLTNMREREDALEVVGNPRSIDQLEPGDSVLLVDDDRTLVLRDGNVVWNLSRPLIFDSSSISDSILASSFSS